MRQDGTLLCAGPSGRFRLSYFFTMLSRHCFLRILVSTLAGFMASPEACAKVAHSADVIVYGSTPAGFCAAVGAAREGATVILVEPTPHVGGVNTGGLCFSDSNQMFRTHLKGVFEEFHLRMEADYK